MLGRTLLTATLFALSSFTTAAAAPPGCLLGAVNTYADPADVKAVCQSKDAAQTIQKFCGDATKDALSAFADICMGAGVKVCKYCRFCFESGCSWGLVGGVNRREMNAYFVL
jgi:hypothetical protein